MKIDLDAERRAIQRTWKKREKQIGKVFLNTSHMYNFIRSIAGKAIQNVEILELPSSEESK